MSKLTSKSLLFLCCFPHPHHFLFVLSGAKHEYNIGWGQPSRKVLFLCVDVACSKVNYGDHLSILTFLRGKTKTMVYKETLTLKW
jgi:hypothetical protein